MTKETWPRRLRQRLLPGAAERDEGFLEDLRRTSHAGLRAVGGVEIGAAVFLVAAPFPGALRLRLLEAAVPLTLGAVTIALSRIEATYAWSRVFGWVSCCLAASAMNWFSLLWRDRATADFVFGPVTALVLVAVAAVPLRPMHTLGLGCSIGASYAGFARWLAPVAGPQPAYAVFVLLLTLLATGLTAVVYEERHAAYESWVRTMRALEDLRQTQSRMMLSESAASLGRLAAALSHELNSPIGALMSAVDTLLLLAAKQAVSPPEGQERLVRLQADLRRSMQESARRLQEIVGRMQRFTNLDRAEVQRVDLNGLLGDVLALLEPETAKRVALELDPAPVPPLLCRPQQLSAVFSGLLSNATGAVDCGGRIVVATRQRDSRIEVEIRDDGRGIAPQQLQTIFDPGFRVSGDRVVSGNWSMFGARQIVREHGGEIRIASGEGRGTTVTVTLPLNNREIRA